MQFNQIERRLCLAILGTLAKVAENTELFPFHPLEYDQS